MNNSGVDNSNGKGFGTPIQKFTQELTKSLARFSITEKLTDKNFMRWSQPVLETLMSLDYVLYVKKRSYKDESLSNKQHLKVKFVLTTWLLSLMDNENVQRCRVHLTVRAAKDNEDSSDNDDSETEDELYMTYEPAILWRFLKSHHQSISESSLSVIDTALHAMKISREDSLVTHSDKFNNVMLEFYQYQGKMSDVQSARLLIKTLGDRLTETTKELVYQTVKPLTRQGVTDYLKEYELRNGGFTTAAIREANASSAGPPEAAQSVSRSARVKCSKEKCVGVHHTAEECFSKPQNFKKRDAWIAKKDAERANSSNPPRSNSIVGMKELSAPAASLAENSSEYLSFNSEFIETFSMNEAEDDSLLIATHPNQPTTVSSMGCPSIYGEEVCAMHSTSSSKDIWGLFDKGATHYMFNDIELFESKSISTVSPDNNKLKLAGGKAKLNVISKGTVKLRAGDGSGFEFTNCLFIPDLSRHLIAGGLMIRKGIQVIINPSNPKCFSLVYKNKALFNGIFLDNNLMLVKIIPVSDLSSTLPRIPEALSSEINSTLLHRRLGHISSRYLRTMCRKGCVIGHLGVEVVNENCTVCALSKGTKLPHSNTRPRASRFLENIHVDLSGIIRSKGLNNEIYFILFATTTPRSDISSH